uniref:Gustatory receptor n=1 Tax=Tetranychus urticae TaxID=32264 RepID=T1JTP0_TETUR
MQKLKSKVDTMVERIRFFIVNIEENLFRLVGRRNSSEIVTAKAINLYDKLFGLFVSRRGGLQQTLDQPIKIKFHAMNWFTRFLILFFIVRLCLGIFVRNDYVGLLMANPFSNKDDKKNAILLFILFLITYIYGIREFTLRLEETGRIKMIRMFSMLEKQGFNTKALNMNFNRCKQFQKWCHLIFVNNLMNIICLNSMSLFLIIYLRASQRTSSLFMIHIIHMVIEWITVCLLIINVMCSTSYIIVMVTFFIGQLNTLTDSIKNLALNSSLSNSISFKLNYRLIELLNHIGQWNDDWKYLFQYCILAASFLGNFTCFAGFLHGFQPDATTRTMTVVGIFVHILIYIGSYLGSLIHSEAIKIRRCYCKLMSTTKNHEMHFRLKSMEILDRLDSHLIGAHLGDFGIIKQSTCIILLLENASFIMLLSCNIRSFI